MILIIENNLARFGSVDKSGHSEADLGARPLF
jgi:hypothetical protein